jgi:hypothetical protein
MRLALHGRLQRTQEKFLQDFLGMNRNHPFFGHFQHILSLVAIDDFDIMGTSSVPPKTDPPLAVNTDAVLRCPLPLSYSKWLDGGLRRSLMLPALCSERSRSSSRRWISSGYFFEKIPVETLSCFFVSE